MEMGECPVYDGKPGAVIIVGCHGDSDDGSGSGSAYLYRWIDDAIQAPRKLKAEDAGSGDAFGSAVGLIDNSGDAIALVSAPFWDQPSYTNIGAIYAFDGVSGQATEELDYDADGNLTDDGEMLYFYDAENRLIQIKPKAPELGDFRVSFTYDYMGRRVRKVTEVWCDGVSTDSPCDGQPEGWVADPDGDIRFIYDGWNVVMERRFNGTTEDVVHKFAWGADLSGLNGAAASGSASAAVHGAGGIGGLLAVEEHDPGYVFTVPAKYLYFYDGNGNVGQVVTLDIGEFGEQEPPADPPPGTLPLPWMPIIDPGSIAARYEYDPYGGTLVASKDGWMTNPFRFSTKYYDAQPATAAAGERGLYYYGYRYYSPRMGRWVTRDPLAELGGPHLYCGMSNNSISAIDPKGGLVILIHGVNTLADWFKTAKNGLRAAWKREGKCEQSIFEFKWGNHAENFQGGSPLLATDSVSSIYSDKDDRAYMIEAIDRLYRIISRLQAIKQENKCDESISVIAHSQGTILTIGALMKGAKIDTLIMMGSPLSVQGSYNDPVFGRIPESDGHREINSIRENVSGHVFNYWSESDQWAWIKGGIGASAGNADGHWSGTRWIQYRKFGPGEVIHGYRLPQLGEFERYRHSHYMKLQAFFERIHAKDLYPNNCCCLDSWKGEVRSLSIESTDRW